MKKVILLLLVFITTIACKKYYNCNCTRVIETVTSQPNAPTTTYSASTTSFTVPVYSTNKNKTSTCAGQAGTNGLTTITCTVN